jgi:hypothetical protein
MRSRVMRDAARSAPSDRNQEFKAANPPNRFTKRSTVTIRGWQRCRSRVWNVVSLVRRNYEATSLEVMVDASPDRLSFEVRRGNAGKKPHRWQR